MNLKSSNLEGKHKQAPSDNSPEDPGYTRMEGRCSPLALAIEMVADVMYNLFVL